MSCRALHETLDAWFARGVAAAGPGVVPCRRGCSACCHGPFDISPADAALVAEGVAVLAPAPREALLERAMGQLRRSAAVLPEWGAPWDVDALDEVRFDELVERLADEPCPALGADGACLIHAHRPATCRLTGLSLSTPEGDVLENHCPIQAQFPGYAALPPTPFDLQQFEAEAEREDAAAVAAGWFTTTVAGAIAGVARRDARHP